MILGLLSETSTSSMRPPMLAGPMLRNRNALSAGSVDWLIIGVAAACPPPCALAIDPKTERVRIGSAYLVRRVARLDIRDPGWWGTWSSLAYVLRSPQRSRSVHPGSRNQDRPSPAEGVRSEE